LKISMVETAGGLKKFRHLPMRHEWWVVFTGLSYSDLLSRGPEKSGTMPLWNDSPSNFRSIFKHLYCFHSLFFFLNEALTSFL
jgi:hypothetical protein